MTIATRAIVLACVVVSGVARAEPAAPLATEAAAAHFQAGQVYFEQGDPRRAAVEFLAAQRDDDRPALDFNLSLCYERLDDPGRASSHLRRYLLRATDVPDRAVQDERLARFEARTGELEVRSRGPAVRLLIDDEPAPPSGRLRLSAGAHRVAAEKEGRERRELIVQVNAGALARVELDPVAPAAEQHHRRRGLAIGLGLAGGIVVIGSAITLGIVLGARTRPAYVGNAGVIVVDP